MIKNYTFGMCKPEKEEDKEQEWMAEDGGQKISPVRGYPGLWLFRLHHGACRH